ncbi:alpha/beta hydrolase family esterase [Fimbriimonas ginsengisoli]|uniref:alpha/beta hydrolase family esterase n=1 Tax=Fimbriimonas ginsengisoli TaxID=1005039 RepID=UPI00118695AC|nr:esterase [Fimbriimonas ginsengisoli]
MLLLLAGQDSAVQIFKVGALDRQAIVVAPKSAKPPLVFVFHGHGGNMRQAQRSFGIEGKWPEAMVVYPQGLPTKGITDPEGKLNGWQQKKGDYEDRDLAFFDAMMRSFHGKFDPKRVYVTGHSNGGRMTYLLWSERGNILAAVAPSASPAVLGIRNAKAIPAFIVAGTEDKIVPYRIQEMSINAVRRHLGTDASKGRTDGYTRLEPGADGLELGTYIFPGPHSIPKPAIEQIVAFFKRH